MVVKNGMRVVREYWVELRKVFGDHLEQVILYGSFVRGEGQEHSDIDILVVLKGPFDYMEAIRKTSSLTAELSMKYGVAISRVFVTPEDLKNNPLSFYLNIRREGKAA